MAFWEASSYYARNVKKSEMKPRRLLAADLDVNSYFESSLDKAEREFVEDCTAIVGDYLGKKRSFQPSSLATSLAK